MNNIQIEKLKFTCAIERDGEREFESHPQPLTTILAHCSNLFRQVDPTNIQRFSSYLTENTLYLLDKDHLADDIQVNSHCSLSESYEIRNCT
jgi:hypothetical protein